jgi:hypothetical protein
VILRNKHSGKVIILDDGAYEVFNAFIVPLRCLYKVDYECIDEKKKRRKHEYNKIFKTGRK